MSVVHSSFKLTAWYHFKLWKYRSFDIIYSSNGYDFVSPYNSHPAGLDRRRERSLRGEVSFTCHLLQTRANRVSTTKTKHVKCRIHFTNTHGPGYIVYHISISGDEFTLVHRINTRLAKYGILGTESYCDLENRAIILAIYVHKCCYGRSSMVVLWMFQRSFYAWTYYDTLGNRWNACGSCSGKRDIFKSEFTFSIKINFLVIEI